MELLVSLLSEVVLESEDDAVEFSGDFYSFKDVELAADTVSLAEVELFYSYSGYGFGASLYSILNCIVLKYAFGLYSSPYTTVKVSSSDF